MEFELAGKQMLVTGATGFIGQQVTRALLAQGVCVRALVRNESKAQALREQGAVIVPGDLTDPASAQAVQGCDAVLHLGGVVNEFEPMAYYRSVNVEPTRRLAEAALEAGVERFVHVSSIWVYQIGAGPVVTEDSPLAVAGIPYPDSKREGELVIRQMIKQRGLPAVIVQPSEVYGPRDQTWVLRPVELLRTGRMILADGGSGVFQPIYVDDAVEGLMSAMRKGKIGETYILPGREQVRMRDYFGYYVRMLGKRQPPSMPGWLALQVAALAEKAAPVLKRPPVFTRQEALGSLKRAVYDGSKAERELGFVPKTTLAEGMRQVEAWLRSIGLVQAS